MSNAFKGVLHNLNDYQDPVISYGSVSNHVHKISGAATININSTYESLQESDCTSCSIQGVYHAI